MQCSKVSDLEFVPLLIEISTSFVDSTSAVFAQDRFPRLFTKQNFTDHVKNE